MNKYIEITFPNGDQFLVPIKLVGTSYANYYGASNEDDWKCEYERCISDNDELLDWFSNNMNWSDVSGQSVKVTPPPYDFDKNFTESSTKIVEKF